MAGDAERQAWLAGTYQLGNGFAVTGDDDGFAFLDQFQEPGELSFSLVYIDLHGTSLVYLVS